MGITKEEIFNILLKEGLNPKYINADKFGFSRQINFSAMDIDYCITWFANMSHICVGEYRFNHFYFTEMTARGYLPFCERALVFQYGIKDDNPFAVYIKK